MRAPVSTLAELALLDRDEIAAGYWCALHGGEMQPDASAGYEHGYLVGLVDAGLAKPSRAQLALLGEWTHSLMAVTA